MGRQVLLVGGVEGRVRRSLAPQVEKLGLEVRDIWSWDKRCTDHLPIWCQGVIVFKDMIGHNICEQIKGLAADRKIPCAIVPHQLSHAMPVLESCGMFRTVIAPLSRTEIMDEMIKMLVARGNQAVSQDNIVAGLSGPHALPKADLDALFGEAMERVSAARKAAEAVDLKSYLEPLVKADAAITMDEAIEHLRQSLGDDLTQLCGSDRVQAVLDDLRGTEKRVEENLDIVAIPSERAQEVYASIRNKSIRIVPEVRRIFSLLSETEIRDLRVWIFRIDVVLFKPSQVAKDIQFQVPACILDLKGKPSEFSMVMYLVLGDEMPYVLPTSISKAYHGLFGRELPTHYLQFGAEALGLQTMSCSDRRRDSKERIEAAEQRLKDELAGKLSVMKPASRVQDVVQDVTSQVQDVTEASKENGLPAVAWTETVGAAPVLTPSPVTVEEVLGLIQDFETRVGAQIKEVKDEAATLVGSVAATVMAVSSSVEDARSVSESKMKALTENLLLQMVTVSESTRVLSGIVKNLQDRGEQRESALSGLAASVRTISQAVNAVNDVVTGCEGEIEQLRTSVAGSETEAKSARDCGKSALVLAGDLAERVHKLEERPAASVPVPTSSTRGVSNLAAILAAAAAVNYEVEVSGDEEMKFRLVPKRG
jgi:hypothetical protein